MREVTYGSLFSGIGGMDLGLERASNDQVRFVCKWQVENNKYAQKVLEKHWPKVQREKDIRDCGSINLPRVDVIIGGFPCQDISYAGKGAGLEGERSGLWYEFARIIRELEPRVVVVENVRALLTKGIDRVLGTLASLRYDAEWHCVSAAGIGAPHIRDRVFIIGTLRTDSDSIGLCENAEQWEKQQGADASRDCGAEHSADFSSIGKGRIEEQQFVYRDISGFKETCSRWWRTEPAMGELVDGLSGGLVRFEGRTCSDTPYRRQKLRGLGNAVVPQVMQLVGTWVREMFED